MVDFAMNVKGAKELEAKLGNLEKKIAKKIVRQAARVSQKILAKTVKSNALTMVGGDMGRLIARNVKVRGFKKQKKGSYGISVFLKGGVNEFIGTPREGKASYIPFSIEYGHVAVNGTVIPANPFMRSAHDSTKQLRQNRFRRLLVKGILTEAKKKTVGSK